MYAVGSGRRFVGSQYLEIIVAIIKVDKLLRGFEPVPEDRLLCFLQLVVVESVVVKPRALVGEHTVSYGSTIRSGGRRRGVSGSSSGERLQRVPEDEDTTEGGGSPPSWTMREVDDVEAARNNGEAGDEEDAEEEEEETLQGTTL